jgi:hypothetical protein
MNRWRMSSTGLEPHRDGEWVLFTECITVEPPSDQQIVDHVMHEIALQRGASTRRDFEVALLTLEAASHRQQAKKVKAKKVKE